MLTLVNVIWGARCGESARRVLLGETRSRGHAYSVRRGRESVHDRKAPHGLPSTRLVSTNPFDLWMLKKWKHLPFERYADDIIVHCRAEWEANMVRAGVEARLKECGLQLHPEKTKLVYCKDANRQENHSNEQFDFLGFTFRPRQAINRKGKVFCSFSPAISNDAKQKTRDEIRGWQLHRRTAQSLGDLARMINPKLRGWCNSYGRYLPSALRPIERYVGQSLVRWACRKYRKLRNHRSRAWQWLLQVIDRQPALLALWERQRSGFHHGSRMSREAHVRFWKGLGVRFLGAT